MSDLAIRVENLGKLYRIGRRERYKALRDTLADAISAPFRAVRALSGNQPSSESGPDSGNFIWALKNVSFEVKQGDVIGVIGRNGAGKSTLLKILSRITKPTEGYAEIHGRVGSLLKVGAGFHPERHSPSARNGANEMRCRNTSGNRGRGPNSCPAPRHRDPDRQYLCGRGFQR